jgi:hypothetical protein
MFRGRLRTASAVGIALAATLALSPRVPAAASSTPPPLLNLDVLLTISPDLSALSQRALIAETERIWRREQVALRWPSVRGGEERPDAPLRVLVIARPSTASFEDGRWPVGELLPQDGRRALAIASISGAQRVVLEAASRYQVLDLPALADYRLGLVLGRAVAHEIGHFLLATATHAERGLMRATIDAREFADTGAGGTFGLDADAGRWLRQRLSGGQPAISELRAAGFSYLR